MNAHLVAAVVDELRVANWQRANAGAKKSEQTTPPDPIERPGVTTRRKNSDALPLAELREELERRRSA